MNDLLGESCHALQYIQDIGSCSDHGNPSEGDSRRAYLPKPDFSLHRQVDIKAQVNTASL